MDVSSIAEQLLFTTVRIETRNSKGEVGIGTGFIFKYTVGLKHALFLVTNKHIISGTINVELTFIRGSENKPVLGSGYSLHLGNVEKLFFGHKRQNVDVTILPFVWFVEHIKEAYEAQIFFKTITTDLIPNEEALKAIDAIEEVVFIGYPSGLWDSKSGIPIVRRGITATPINLDFWGEKQFLIDASVFPGSSGSPVFLYNPGAYWEKGKGTVVGRRLFFLGIVASVFFRRDLNKIEMINIPTGEIPVAITTQMIDLGLVFKAETIVETIEEFVRHEETGKYQQQLDEFVKDTEGDKK